MARARGHVVSVRPRSRKVAISGKPEMGYPAAEFHLSALLRKLPDSRYTMAEEFTGESRPERVGKRCHVVRFCGEWVCRADTAEEAAALARDHSIERMRSI